MKKYTGSRQTDGPARVEVIDGDSRYDLDPRLDLWNHSPDGFEWGYGGSGPSQLALAILADYFGPEGDDLVNAIYQEYKREIIARITGDKWEISDHEVKMVIDKLLLRKRR